MIKRIYIDNYKSLVNFEMNLERVNLFMGENGSGKSAVLEVVAKLAQWTSKSQHLRGLERPFPFDSTSMTRWSAALGQRLEIDLVGVDRIHRKYTAAFTFESKSDDGSVGPRTVGEKTFDFGPQSKNSELRLERSGPTFKVYVDGIADARVDERKSVLNSPQGLSVPTLRELRDDLSRVLHFKPQGGVISDDVDTQLFDAELAPNFENFAAWVVGQQANDAHGNLNYIERVSQVLTGFAGLKTYRSKGMPSLWAAFKTPTDAFGRTEQRYRLSELSDGQRTILCLYAISQWLLTPGFVLMIDEPENFIALKELQPWLLHVIELAEKRDGQLIIVSHHPEFLDYLARDHGIVFWRENGGATQIKRFAVDADTPLPPSELVASGLV